MPVISALNGFSPDMLSQVPVTEQSTIHNPQSAIERERLRKATREMEGYFVGMLLRKMHESAVKGGLFDQRSDSATYREMFDDAIAAEVGRRGAFGIADMLYKELVVQLQK